MKFEELFRHTFKAISADLGLPRRRVPMVQPTDTSDFCQEAVAKGCLSQEQMTHAAKQYRLGRSRSGRTIFWMIDELGQVLDGRIGDSWVSQMLKVRYPENAKFITPEHCLFGLHLLGVVGGSVAVVESEQSCVILSELFPTYTWMAWSYPANLTEWQLKPLQGRQVVLFPRTDPVGDYYLASLEVADQARRRHRLDITVDSTLEDRASEEQKDHCIDLVDYLFPPDPP